MRLSDLTKPTGNISTVQSLLLLDKNSGASGKQVDWRGMKIGMTEGARESNPFGELRRLATDAKASTRKRRLHDALDELLKDSDSEEPLEETDSEEVEADDAEIIQTHSAVDMRGLQDAAENFKREVGRHLSRAVDGSPAASRRGYIADADSNLLSRYLQPAQSCEQGLISLRDKLYCRQKDSSTMGFWRGLCFHISSQPSGTLMRDLRPATLVGLLRPLDENRF